MRIKKYKILLGTIVVLLILWKLFSYERRSTGSLLLESRLPEAIWEEKKQEPKQKKEAENPSVRVIIKTNGFKDMKHPSVKLQAEHGLVYRAAEEQHECAPGEMLELTPTEEAFQKGTVWVEPKEPTDRIGVISLKRGYGVPSYRGKMELFLAGDGLVLVNELPLEEYLYGVVPSEMPSTFEMEALKAQAVCARSYAYNQTQGMAYPEYRAHIDDSTSFQVYGNSKEQDTSIRAVEETKGQKLWQQNHVVTAYYYSTSCGKTTSMEAWGTAPTEENAYLRSVDICKENGDAYEKELPWFRWKAVVPDGILSRLIEQNTKTKIGQLQSVTITKQGPGGVALQMVVKGSQGSVTVETENKIRRALGGSGYDIEKQDGTKSASQNLLPSAFISIEKKEQEYIISGGGLGHGIGMSQNGANEMAKAGKNYIEILQTFYQGVSVKA